MVKLKTFRYTCACKDGGFQSFAIDALDLKDAKRKVFSGSGGVPIGAYRPTIGLPIAWEELKPESETVYIGDWCRCWNEGSDKRFVCKVVDFVTDTHQPIFEMYDCTACFDMYVEVKISEELKNEN